MLNASHVQPEVKPLTFRAYHASMGDRANAEVLELPPIIEAAADPAGPPRVRWPTVEQLTALLTDELGLTADDARGDGHADTHPDAPPKRDQARTWLLRNVTKDKLLDGELDIDEGDEIEVLSRSTAGTRVASATLTDTQ